MLNFNGFDRLEFSYDKIVIGSTLPALLYCYYNKLPFLSTKDLERPDPFDFFPKNLNLKKYKIKNGSLKIHLWDILYFELGLKGMNLMGQLAKSIRIDDDNNIVRAPTYNGRVGRFKYKNLIIFSERNLHGLPSLPSGKEVDPYYKVIDYFSLKSDKYIPREVGSLNITEQYTSSLACYFKIDNPTVAVSYCKRSELETWDFSIQQTTFKLLNYLKKEGFKGRTSGLNPRRKDGISRYALKLDHINRYENIIEREVFYKDTDKLSFKYDSDIELIKSFSKL